MQHPLPRTIGEAAAAYRSRQLSPIELTRTLLNRIEALDPLLHTFRHITAELALQAARRAEEELRGGKDRGPLHGIPVTLKDNMAYAGTALTNGSSLAFSGRPAAHSDIARKLTDAGAVILGLTHMHEFAYGPHRPDMEAVRNPWRPDRIPGGSSSGAAAGLAAGFALGAVGTDTAGSVRVPASFCGVVGFKPTQGLISLHGTTPLAPSLDHAGVLARFAADAELLVQALAVDPGRLPSAASRALAAASIADGKTPLAGLRVGVLEDLFGEPTEERTAAVAREALAVLAEAGAKLVPVRFEWSVSEMKEAAWTILHAEAARELTKLGSGRRAMFGPGLAANLARAEALPPKKVEEAMRWRGWMCKRMKGAWSETDVWVGPTCPWPARRIGSPAHPGGAVNGEYAPFANLWGLPALSFPAGFSEDGLPIGVQIVGPLGADSLVLAVGKWYEKLTGRQVAEPDDSLWGMELSHPDGRQ
ncbi:amidase [Cohnella sp. AR92]|uniref:amidase n=1 Tax=Cohnella sp. AR92 TaxID=648716 RepID=UPI001315AA18|nr:amidase [Cohnella sp. AR92]